MKQSGFFWFVLIVLFSIAPVQAKVPVFLNLDGTKFLDTRNYSLSEDVVHLSAEQQAEMASKLRKFRLVKSVGFDGDRLVIERKANADWFEITKQVHELYKLYIPSSNVLYIWHMLMYDRQVPKLDLPKNKTAGKLQGFRRLFFFIP